MEVKDVARLVFAIAVCQIAGVIGSIFTTPSIPTWYSALQKPSFAPPNWLFAPVWIALFTLMGVSAYLVWNKGLENPGVRISLSVFGIQLALCPFRDR